MLRPRRRRLGTCLREQVVTAAGSAVGLVATLEMIAVFGWAQESAGLASVPKWLDPDFVVVFVDLLKARGIHCG